MDKEDLFDMSSDSLEDVESFDELMDLSGKVAVVSGSVGLALFVVNRLAELGAKVVFGARSEEWGEMAVEALEDLGRENVVYHPYDTRDVAASEELVKFAEETFGPVDICVPVAATWQARAFLDMDEALYDDIVDTDMKGQYFLVQACARSMVRAKHGGKIVTIASVAYKGQDMAKLAMMTPYNAAKAGVIGMTRGIAKELKQYDINVNCVAPGGMVTPGAIANCVETVEKYGAGWQHDQMTLADAPVAPTPDMMARMIATMCTHVSDFMYGSVVDVCGGAGLSFQEKPWSYTMEGGLHA
ncbi:MAG: SDR family NAD(P)-dependent oxidoreductase [Atopobiaceae bacterium]|nr:SDR family NAD(P)-dependent oxidoreductase [Atopobiaceae bacterium]